MHERFGPKDVTPTRIGVARAYPSPRIGGGCGCGCTSKGGCAGTAPAPHARVPLGATWPTQASIRWPGSTPLRPTFPAFINRSFESPQCCRREPLQLDPVVYPDEYDALRLAFADNLRDLPSCDRGLTEAFHCEYAWRGNLIYRLMERCAASPRCNPTIALRFIDCIVFLSGEEVTVRASSRGDCQHFFPEGRCQGTAWMTAARSVVLPGRIDVFAGGGRVDCGERCAQWAFRGQPCP